MIIKLSRTKEKFRLARAPPAWPGTASRGTLNGRRDEGDAPNRRIASARRSRSRPISPGQREAAIACIKEARWKTAAGLEIRPRRPRRLARCSGPCGGMQAVVRFCHDPVVAQCRHPQDLERREAEPVPRIGFRSGCGSSVGLERGENAAGFKPAEERWAAQAQRRPAGPVGDNGECAMAHLLLVSEGRRL